VNIPDRIVSIFDPEARPIKKGKLRVPTEFGVDRKWQRIKALHARGVSIREIARTLGVSRNTVRKYLKAANPLQFKARGYEKQLDRYREEIQAML